MTAESRLPEQHPDPRRLVPLRHRTDRWTVPSGHPHEPRDYAHPFETYDAANEARPFELRELADPKLWLEGGLAVAIAVIALIVVLASGPQVAP